MTDAEVATLVDRVGGALVAAAEVGISHGRLSADNVLFDDAGEPCVADFSPVVPEPGQNARDDVAALAALVRACLARRSAVRWSRSSSEGHRRPTARRWPSSWPC